MTYAEAEECAESQSYRNYQLSYNLIDLVFIVRGVFG